MNYILDTHIFLWALFEPEKLSKKIESAILDRKSTIYVSAISFWEISLKFALGKIDLRNALPDELPKTAIKDGFEILNLNIDTISSFYKLPRIRNKDPFDRMLAWQTINEGYSLLTQDPDFSDFKDHGLNVLS